MKTYKEQAAMLDKFIGNLVNIGVDKTMAKAIVDTVYKEGYLHGSHGPLLGNLQDLNGDSHESKTV